MAAGMFYWLTPRLWNRGKLHSTSAGQHALLARARRHPALRLLHVGERHHAGPHAQRYKAKAGTVLANPNFRRRRHRPRNAAHAHPRARRPHVSSRVSSCSRGTYLEDRPQGAQAVNGTIDVFIEEKAAAGTMSLVERSLASAPVIYSSRCCIVFAHRLGCAARRAGQRAVDLSAPSSSVQHGHDRAQTGIFRLRAGGEWYERVARKRAARSPCSPPSPIFIGGIVQIIPTDHHRHRRKHRGRAPDSLHAAGTRGPRHLRPRRLLQLPLAADPHARRRRACATADYSKAGRVHLRPSVSNGARSAPAPTSPAKATEV